VTSRRAAHQAGVLSPATTRLTPAASLALQLWLTSMLCWWIIGIPFSLLWWLVNASQQRWILICYAWEVPAVGWTGAVLLPVLGFRRLQRRLEAGDPAVGPDLARFPFRVALLVIGTSSVGYLLGAIQLDHFAYLPDLEFAKITVQGPVLGGLFAVAAYLMAERAVERLGLPRKLDARGLVPIQALEQTTRPAKPATPSATQRQVPTPAGSGSRAGERPMVLVIDDERSVRMALTRYFERSGWEVRQAEDGSEALELLADPAAPAYQVVITDLRMPGRTGVEVHDWLAAHRPQLFERLIVATGDVASPSIREFIRRTTRPVLEKPFELGALAALVQRVTAAR
jgi:CheY-like chemotaxis protein